jgi:cob(I)alamin adenosyltransferase
MSDFFTRDGDDGYTGLLGEARVPKHSPRPDAFGAMDETTSALGLARALALSSETRDVLLTAQRDVYRAMAEVAATPEVAPRFRALDASRVGWLETEIGRFGRCLEAPRQFIVPGDAPSSAALDLARVTVRRAERSLARLAHETGLGNPEILRYFNRLSSLCFVLELWENGQAGIERPTLARGEGG